jgi:hypothetical protein
MVVLPIEMLARTQQSVTLASTGVAWSYETVELKKKYSEISTLLIADPRDLFVGSASERSILWKVHLALLLVKNPEMNERQVRIVLDAISLSTPEFFAASSDTPAQRTRADSALQSLIRRAIGAFPDSQAAELFTKIAGRRAEEDILEMYFDISALPLRTRKAAFRNAPSNIKRDLWRTHLALFLVRQSDLNARQTQIILAAMSLATREHFEVRSTDPHWKVKVGDPLRLLEGQIVTAFSLEDATKIFATLGDATQLAKSSASILLRSINYKRLSNFSPLKQRTDSRFRGQEMAIEQGCECSTSSDYCPILKTCISGACSETTSGCGTFWSYPCNGACR